ncbi:MAG: endo-1,4-beta-xylanase [Pseudomonadota bacterium]
MIWKEFFPDYLNALTPEALRAELEDHIRTVVGRYRGRMTTWVVVNEAVLRGQKLESQHDTGRSRRKYFG